MLLQNSNAGIQYDRKPTDIIRTGTELKISSLLLTIVFRHGRKCVSVLFRSGNI